jgi:hypothetical protein
MGAIEAALSHVKVSFFVVCPLMHVSLLVPPAE